jgi:hypothetical protein
MPCLSIASRFRRTARRFAVANDGNIAMLFGIALLPILTFVGAASYDVISTAPSSTTTSFPADQD